MRNYSNELKEKALRLITEEERSFRSVSKELHIPLTTLFGWGAKSCISKLKQKNLIIKNLEEELLLSKVFIKQHDEMINRLKDENVALSRAVQVLLSNREKSY